MSTQLTKTDDKNVISLLQQETYPGIPDKTAELVINYCRHHNIDPLLKSIHLIKYGDKYQIIPGIAQWRIQASRSGQYVGITEPEFGPQIEDKLGSKTIRFPEWCKITVKRKVDGIISEFTAKEFWVENYKELKDRTPNSMWLKRKFGMLAKCTEAQALRKAFPEIFGGIYTYEEMQGKFEDKEIKDISDYDHGKKAKTTVKSTVIESTANQVLSSDEIEEILGRCSNVKELQDASNVISSAGGDSGIHVDRLTKFHRIRILFESAKSIDELKEHAKLVDDTIDDFHKSKLTTIYKIRNKELSEMEENGQ